MIDDQKRVAKNDAAAEAAWIEGEQMSALAIETKIELFSGREASVKPVDVS